jgi:hypothetical protein
LEPTNLLAYLKLPTKVLASVGLVAFGILFLPATWVAALGLAQIRTQYPATLGIAILLATGALIIEGTVFVSGWLRSQQRAMPYERYRTDEFFGLRWRWQWDLGKVVGPRAFCLHCDLELDATSITAGIMATPTRQLRYQCEGCGKTNITLRAWDALELARTAAQNAEREARKRGLLDQ